MKLKMIKRLSYLQANDLFFAEKKVPPVPSLKISQAEDNQLKESEVKGDNQRGESQDTDQSTASTFDARVLISQDKQGFGGESRDNPIWGSPRLSGSLESMFFLELVFLGNHVEHLHIVQVMKALISILKASLSLLEVHQCLLIHRSRSKVMVLSNQAGDIGLACHPCKHLYGWTKMKKVCYYFIITC